MSRNNSNGNGGVPPPVQPPPVAVETSGVMHSLSEQMETEFSFSGNGAAVNVGRVPHGAEGGGAGGGLDVGAEDIAFRRASPSAMSAQSHVREKLIVVDLHLFNCFK